MATVNPPADNPRSEANRRRSQRVGLMTQVESRATRTTSIGRTQDISVDGLLVLARETFDPKTEVEFRLNLPPIPPGRPIEGQGIVVRTRPGVEMAIQFLYLKDDDRQAIADFIGQGEEGF
ncbi:MAG: PilZ domain-containing protein [Candidatus Acidiferrales bacterium]